MEGDRILRSGGTGLDQLPPDSSLMTAVEQRRQRSLPLRQITREREPGELAVDLVVLMDQRRTQSGDCLRLSVRDGSGAHAADRAAALRSITMNTTTVRAEDWITREDMAALARLVAEHRWTCPRRLTRGRGVGPRCRAA